MSQIHGDLALMPLEDILQGAEKRHLSGTLRLKRGRDEKTFYFRDGEAIFAVSTLPGERLSEFLHATGCLDLERARAAMARSAEGEPTPDLLQEKVFEREELESALRQLILLSLSEALQWRDGTFELKDELPPGLLTSPVQVAVCGALDQALRLVETGEPCP